MAKIGLKGAYLMIPIAQEGQEFPSINGSTV